MLYGGTSGNGKPKKPKKRVVKAPKMAMGGKKTSSMEMMAKGGSKPSMAAVKMAKGILKKAGVSKMAMGGKKMKGKAVNYE